MSNSIFNDNNIPLRHAEPEEHRRRLAIRLNASLPKDGSQPATQPIQLHSVAVADLPDAANWEGSFVYVNDESGGAVIAYSDGTNWRRTTDRAVAS